MNNTTTSLYTAQAAKNFELAALAAKQGDPVEAARLGQIAQELLEALKVHPNA